MRRILLVSSDTPSRKIYVSKRDYVSSSYAGYHLTAALGQISPNWAF
jgi:hypothetical protein